MLIRPLRHRRGNATGHAVKRAPKPDDEPELAHPRAVGFADRRSAARVDDDPCGRRLQARENTRFEIPEPLHPVVFDHRFAGLARAPLDLAIELDDRRAEVPRQDRRDRRLADAGWAGEEEVHYRGALPPGPRMSMGASRRR